MRRAPDGRERTRADIRQAQRSSARLCAPSTSQKQPQEASEFIRMEECGTHPYPKAPLRRGRSFRNPVLRFFHEHEILHHQSTDHHRRSRPPSAAQELQLRLQPSERRHGWWMGSCSDTWSAPFLQGLGVAFRVQLPPEGAQTQTRALIQFRGEATF